MNFLAILSAVVAPNTSDITASIYISAILIALFVMFLVIKNRRR